MDAFDRYVRWARVAHVVDGDTIDLEIDLGWSIRLTERVRLQGVNAPEVRGAERAAGIAVEAKVQKWCDRYVHVWLESTEYERGKYGRTLGKIHSPSGDECLNELVQLWSLEALSS